MTRLSGLFLLAAISLGCGSGAGSPLGAPSNLAAAPLTSAAHLTWSDNSSAETMFMIERKDPGGQFVNAYTVTFDITQYHDAKVTTGSTYSYRVRAMSDSGASEYSNEATVTIK
jgi:fibronectin type 3 domain-containing protein